MAASIRNAPAMKRSLLFCLACISIKLSSGLLLAESAPDIITFFGMCNASAITAVDSDRFIVADDEDNVLRIYRRTGGKPLAEQDVSEFIGNKGKKKTKEADLEASARIGTRTFWISSHGRNSTGKEMPDRQRLFATDIRLSGDSVAIEPTGKPYTGLLHDLINEKRFAHYKFAEAAKIAPKSPGALNIEGLSATPENHLLIGFRNPVPEGKAVLIPLLNPNEVIQGEHARFGDSIELDLGGLGIRGIDYQSGRYMIIAGPINEGGTSRLYEWNGKDQVHLVKGISFAGLNPEGVAFKGEDGTGEYFVISDDGTLPIDGISCKDLEDQTKREFRGKVFKF
ncbi:MAG: hypothetical protein JWL59_4984 [Chthoniobacteraceae bacterium]|nr:hypothetical protein [Chthoniobacteraceae bacterium]